MIPSTPGDPGEKGHRFLKPQPQWLAQHQLKENTQWKTLWKMPVNEGADEVTVETSILLLAKIKSGSKPLIPSQHEYLGQAQSQRLFLPWRKQVVYKSGHLTSF